MFDDVAGEYDLTNDVLSLGPGPAAGAGPCVEAVGRAAGRARPRPRRRHRHLAASRSPTPGVDVVPADFSLGMLRVGNRRRPDLAFTAGDAMRLPFADDDLRRGDDLVRAAQRRRPGAGAARVPAGHPARRPAGRLRVQPAGQRGRSARSTPSTSCARCRRSPAAVSSNPDVLRLPRRVDPGLARPARRSPRRIARRRLAARSPGATSPAASWPCTGPSSPTSRCSWAMPARLGRASVRQARRRGNRLPPEQFVNSFTSVSRHGVSPEHAAEQSDPLSQSATDDRRRHRRRRRARRARATAYLPREGRPRRPAAGEDRVPAREGLRRRAHPARGQAADHPGHRHHARGRRLDPATRACASSAAAAPRAALARARRASRPTAWSAPGMDFDEILARHAVKAGARLHERTNVTGPVLDAHRPRSSASPPSRVDDDGRATGAETDLPRAARGRRRRQLHPARRSRWACSKRDDRPMGVAVRTYYTSPAPRRRLARSPGSSCGTGDDAGNRNLLPGYGWIFGVGDGTANVGLGILNTSTAFGKRRLQGRAAALARRHARGVGLPRREPWSARSAAPRCRWASTASRTTPAACCWSATPAAWSTRSTARASPTPWSPASMAAEVIAQALARADDAGARARRSQGYPQALKDALRRLLHARPGAS